MPSTGAIDVVLLDIEGTICPITFVKDILFPYALQALPDILRTKWDDATFKQYRDAFPSEARASPEALQAYVEDLTKRDVKVAPLKNLQGYLWQAGYESRAYATPLYPDVVPALNHWTSSRKAIVIYSSGSVFAQKLLFSHVKTDTATDPDPETATSTENLTHLIRDWFDTVNAGPKTEPSSYERISKALDTRANAVLFLSDNVKEIAAAQNTGMNAILVERPGNAPVSNEDLQRFRMVTSFDELDM